MLRHLFFFLPPCAFLLPFTYLRAPANACLGQAARTPRKHRHTTAMSADLEKEGKHRHGGQDNV